VVAGRVVVSEAGELLQRPTVNSSN